VTAFQEALAHRTSITNQLQKTSQKKVSLNAELEKLLGGKKSIKTFFKSRTEKDSYSNTLTKQI